MNKNEAEPFQYTICSTPGIPQSLVMLAPIEPILQKILQQVQHLFVWVEPDPDFQFINRISKDLGISIHFCSDWTSAIKFIETHDKKTRFVLICSPALHIQKHNKTFIAQVIGGILYSQRSDNEIEQNQSFFLRAENEEKLRKYLGLYKHRELQYKQLPNFILLGKDAYNSNLTVRTMLAMVARSVDRGVRKKIVKELTKLFAHLIDASFLLNTDKQLVHQFLDELSKTELTPERAIYWYTLQSPVYKFTNNLLRLTRHPFETFYIQPFFKDLFSAVTKVHRKQAMQGKMREFTCYRGGMISESEIKQLMENVGDFVQNLGFLSTSLSLETALIYLKNTYLQIYVEDQGETSGSYGYAFIAQHSQYYQEEEILFNPLNSFRILQVSTKNNKNEEIYFIKLSLEKLGVNEKNYSQKLKAFKGLIQKQSWPTSQYICQGNALLNDDNTLIGCSLYWEIFISLCRKNRERAYGLNYWITSQIAQNNYEKAARLLQELKKMLDLWEADDGGKKLEQFEMHQKPKKLTIEQIQVLEATNSLKVSEYQKKYSQRQKQYHFAYALYFRKLALVTEDRAQSMDKALILYEKAFEIVAKILGKTHREYCGSLQNIAQTYRKRGQFEKSLQFHLKCQQIRQELFGYWNIDNANSLHNLAYFYQLKRDFKKALNLYTKSQLILLKILGESHYQYAASLNDMGITYEFLGKTEEAMRVYRKSIEIVRMTRGENCLDYALILTNLGNLHIRKNQFTISLELYKKCLQIRKLITGENHPLYANSLNNIGIAYEMKGELQQALYYIQNAARIKLKLFGENHIEHAILLKNIAIILQKQGDLQKALKFDWRCLRLVRHSQYCRKYVKVDEVYHKMVVNLENQAEFGRALKMVDFICKAKLEEGQSQETYEQILVWAQQRKKKIKSNMKLSKAYKCYLDFI